MKEYKFAVSLCGGWCNGHITVEADDEEEAYEKAMDHVVGKLVESFPDLDIEYNVECESEDSEDEAEESMEICPVCGAEIDPNDGEDNGYGELHLYWKCDACGSSGKAIIDQHDDNAFIGHEVD